jgi:hypothetical protein
MLKRATFERRPRLLPEIKELVVSYFNREDVTIMCPGKLDCVTVNGEKRQKRFMTQSLKEAYFEFCKEYGKVVSLSTFCEMRPMEIQTFEKVPHNVCACRTHEDFMS